MDNKILREALRHRFVSVKLDRNLSDIEETSFVLFELCAELLVKDGVALSASAIVEKAKIIDIYGEDKAFFSSGYGQKLVALRHDPRIDADDSSAVHNSIIGIMARRLGVYTEGQAVEAISALCEKNTEIDDYMGRYRKMVIARGRQVREAMGVSC